MGLKLGMAFKFCISVSKEFRLKFRNYEALFLTFLEVTEKKKVHEAFLVLNKVKFKTLNNWLWCFEKHQKIKVYSRLDRGSTKHLFTRTTFDKKIGAKSRTLVKLDSTKKIGFLLLYISWLLFPKFNFWQEYLALGSIFDQTWDFTNILYFLKILNDWTTCGATWMPSFLY